MTDTKYLFQRNKTWWVKVAVPRLLRDTLGYDLRRSLHTQDLDEAIAARDAVVLELREEIEEARRGPKHERACRKPAFSDDERGFLIKRREDFSDVTFLLEVNAPLLAKAAKPGQFVIVILHDHGERIPLTIADFDRARGTITLVIQAVGKSTREMQQQCRAGTYLHALVGPMGYPSELRRPQGDLRRRRPWRRADLPAAASLQGSGCLRHGRRRFSQQRPGLLAGRVREILR